MTHSRSEWAAIGFMVVWMVAWTSAILVALHIFGGRVLDGELPAALVLLVWLIGAGFGLYLAARRLLQLVRVGRIPRPPSRKHTWREGVGRREG